MKVHPAPKKRNVALRYDITATTLTQTSPCRQKNLRRVPHIFAKVLELPFHSDADVSIEETPESFRFVVPTDEVTYGVTTHTIEIHPGVTKIVVRGNGVVEAVEPPFGELELDIWRFRLPASTLPELATAAYTDGELVVTVPKGRDEEDEDEGGDIGAGQLVLVQ